MKNIYEIMKSFGLEVPEEKKADFDKLILENYKTVGEVEVVRKNLEKAENERDTYKTKYDEDIKARDTDISNLREQLKNAGVDAEKLTTLQNDLTALQTKYQTEKGDLEAKLAKQAYEFAVKEKASSLKFSSESAKKAFMSDIMKDELKMKDGQLIGFDDFVDAYKKNDEKAFITENTDPNKKPSFSQKTNPKQNDPKEPEGPKDRPVIW